MNYFKNFPLLFSFFLFISTNEVLSQSNRFANPPQVDFSFTKTQYGKNQKEKNVYNIEVGMENGIPQYRVSESIYTSLDFLNDFHSDFIVENQKSLSRGIEVDLEIDSNITTKVLEEIESKLIDLNQLKINFLNNKGEKIRFVLPPKGSEAYREFCLPFQGKYPLKHTIEISEGIFESVNSIYSTESECLKEFVRSRGVFIEIKDDKILIEDEKISFHKMNELLNIKWNSIKKKNTFIVIFKANENSTYSFYLKIFSGILKFYYDQRNRMSTEKYNIPFNETSKKIQREIRTEIPLVILRFYG